MNAIELLVNGTVAAAGLVLEIRGHDPLEYVDAITAATTAVVKENLGSILSEWREATEAYVSEGWLRELVNAQCNDLGLAVYDRITTAD